VRRGSDHRPFAFFWWGARRNGGLGRGRGRWRGDCDGHPHLVKGGLLGQTRGTISEATTKFDSADRNPMWPQHTTRGMRARLLACTASLRLQLLSSTFLTLPPPCPRCIHPAEVSLTVLYHFQIILSCRAQRTSSLRRLAPPFPATRSGMPTFAHEATYQQWLFFSL